MPDSALEQKIQIQLGSNKAIIIVKMILGDYCKKKKKKDIDREREREGDKESERERMRERERERESERVTYLILHPTVCMFYPWTL